ncbi:MAG: hypothetical protein INH12_29185 [Cupriavidus sp.]|jgi:hypothetical protein|uniref:hypothetical protein n=1 Tax=Cupriavidus sp. TaxID=1873897 RepID=UPI0025BFF72D|nr:hypothetical protein [Cupriavidus sp.]MCA3184545.1 hypothetical protein [Cupriavidus sp.]MCA3194146.1 hypothetical protein [Cupriavidus sp.]MCA3235677.1 hypothetical protein [Cupriavidus sp.]MCA3773645.1 hypothetical protein [Cutibacterium sp.]
MDLEKPTNAREQMPSVTEFIDSLRKTFGKEEIDASIKTGLRNGSFFAIENGYVVGTPPPHALLEYERRQKAAERQVHSDESSHNPTNSEALVRSQRSI